MRHCAHVSDASRTNFLFRLHQVLHICPRSSQGRCIGEDIQPITIISYLLYLFHDHCRCETTQSLPQSVYHCHSFIPDISMAPLQVHYYSEALPATALIGPTVSEFTRRTATCNCE